MVNIQSETWSMISSSLIMEKEVMVHRWYFACMYIPFFHQANSFFQDMQNFLYKVHAYAQNV